MSGILQGDVFPKDVFLLSECLVSPLSGRLKENGARLRSTRAVSGQLVLCGEWLSFALLDGDLDSSCVVTYLHLYSYSLGGQSGHFSVGLSSDMRRGLIARFLTLTNGA
jgi:hypothetical protein